jgi:hypothetical protein
MQIAVRMGLVNPNGPNGMEQRMERLGVDERLRGKMREPNTIPQVTGPSHSLPIRRRLKVAANL